MAQMIKTEKYAGPVKDILLAPHLAFALPCQVANTGVSTTNGRKIIPAGTPIGGTTSRLDHPNAVLSVTNTSTTGANAQGVLRYDVDVTDGNATGTIVLGGWVDYSKCPTIDATVKTALKGQITFVNGGRE